MNMPPLPYLARIEGLDPASLFACYADPSVWDGFEPGLMSLCSRTRRHSARRMKSRTWCMSACRPTSRPRRFANPVHTDILRQLEADIDAVTLDGKDVPVKLRVNRSIFVPLAKWSMVMTGNYRCVMPGAARPIRDAVHGDLDASAEIYGWVDALVRDLGASPDDQVPFENTRAQPRAC